MFVITAKASVFAPTKYQGPGPKTVSPDPTPARKTWAVSYRWHLLPYGLWRTSTGREVLFNRHYDPLWSKQPNGEWEKADPSEWVEGVGRCNSLGHTSHFYKDGTPECEKVRVGVEALQARGIPLPLGRWSHKKECVGKQSPSTESEWKEREAQLRAEEILADMERFETDPAYRESFVLPVH